jgi:hypothetical protein
MSMIDGIIDLAAAQSQAQLQTAIATKVLKVANAQGDAALQLIESAMQNVEESIASVAEGLGSGLDAYA